MELFEVFVWRKVLHRIDLQASPRTFSREAFALAARALLFARADLWQQRLRTWSLEKKISARAAWFGIGILDVASLGRLLLALSLAMAAAWAGQLTGWSIFFDNRGEPADILFLIASPDTLSLFVCFSVGLMLGWLFKGRGVGAILAVSLIFPFLISTPGAALLIFGEMAGGATRAKQWTRIWYGRAAMALITAVLFWVFGGFLHGALVAAQADLNLDLLRPEGRLIQVMILIGVLGVTDLVLTMTGLHFGWTLAKRRAAAWILN
jgi:hypothetical protein